MDKCYFQLNTEYEAMDFIAALCSKFDCERKLLLFDNPKERASGHMNRPIFFHGRYSKSLTSNWKWFVEFEGINMWIIHDIVIVLKETKSQVVFTCDNREFIAYKEMDR